MIWFCNFQSNKFNNEASVFLGYAESEKQENGFYFLNIETLFNRIIKKTNDIVNTLYFENLTYDGEFILWWLIKKNFQPQKEGRLKNNEFKEKVDFFGKKIEMYFIYKNRRFDLICSKKVFNLNTKEMGELLNFERYEDIDFKPQKNNLDFEKIPENVKNYSKNKVKILKNKYNEFSKNYKVKKTASSTSWTNFKDWFFENYSKKEWNSRYFWTEDLFNEFNKYYYGGLSFLIPEYKNKELKEEIVKLDINSSYPSQIVKNKLPFGKPLFNKPTGDYCTFIKAVIYDIKKKDKIMISHLHNRAIDNFYKDLYLENFKDLLNVGYIKEEWEEIKKTYDFKIFSYKEIYFKADNKLKEYILNLYDLKEKETDPSKKFNHKLMLNSFTGKWGQNFLKQNRHLKEGQSLNNYDKFSYEIYEKKDFEIKYNILAIWINALARVELLKKIRSNINNVICGDTDSIILFNKDLKDFKIGSGIGEWKKEKEIIKFKAIKQKFYIYQEKDGKINHVLSGINKNKHYLYNFDNFFLNNIIINGNIKLKKINGGVIFEESDITIGGSKNENIKKSPTTSIKAL